MWRLAAIVALLAGAGGLGLWSAIGVLAQQEQPPPLDIAALKQSWTAMSAAEFVSSVNAALKLSVSAELRKELEQAIDAEAARRVLETDVVAQGELSVAHQLLKWTHAAMSPEQQAAIRQKLALRTEQTANLGFDELTDKHQIMQWSSSQQADTDRLIADWLAGRDLSLVLTPNLEWCSYRLTESPLARNQGLLVRWTGSIRPAQSGQYALSVSPLRIDVQARDSTILSTTKVSIDGQVVLDTAAGSPTGQPVTLSADNANSIAVEFRYSHRWSGVNYPHPAVAMLYWQGPGTARQLVPASVLTPPEGGGNGLQGDYQVTTLDGQTVADRRIDPQIDFLWTVANTFIYHDNAKVGDWQRVVQELASRYKASAYMDDLLQQLKEGHTMAGWHRVAELMNSAQRAQILQAIKGRDDLLRAMSQYDMSRIYLLFRAGAETEAIELVGRWMRLHDAPQPEFAMDFYETNRKWSYHVADYLTFEQPEAWKRLEEEYLVSPDGRCSLWTAYAVAYAHAFTGQLDAWIEKLDARLANESLTGDKRVEWLLARAQAEELRGGVARRFTLQPEQYDAGWGWLDEASLSAESEATALRVFREKLTRVAADDRRAQLMQMLEEVETRFTSAESKTAIDAWKGQLVQLAKDFDAAQVKSAQFALKSHADELKRRLASAENANDQDEVGRYQQLIAQAEAALQAQSATSAAPPSGGQPAGGSP